MTPYFIQDNNYLYTLVETMRHSMSPTRYMLMLASNYMKNLNSDTKNPSHMFFKANVEMAERLTRNYKKPEFNITSCQIDGTEYQVKQKVAKKDIFCNLLHFSKPEYKKDQPTLLVIAPMAGHHATLLKGTIQDIVPFFDVYVTDWISASQVPICEGSFDLDSYIDYIRNYITQLGPNVHVYAICQPTVPALAATAMMSEANDTHIPKSLILTGGPIDARKSPTVPNDFALEKNLEWFDNMMITSVPVNYPGYRRRVYPGFLQLTSFISMNASRHVKSHIDLYKSLLIEDKVNSQRQIDFYDEYLAVMDLPAEFFLQTIKEVFHNFSLAKGNFISRGRKVDLKAIKKCALLGIEGEKDDIAAVGQTKAALNLCSNIPDKLKQYHLQKGAGHYGVFSGSKFRQDIVPIIKDFVYKHD